MNQPTDAPAGVTPGPPPTIPLPERREKRSASNGSQQASSAAVVAAILEVGRQRKELLDKARTALLSGNDAEALRCTRQLCGLPA